MMINRELEASKNVPKAFLNQFSFLELYYFFEDRKKFNSKRNKDDAKKLDYLIQEYPEIKDMFFEINDYKTDKEQEQRIFSQRKNLELLKRKEFGMLQLIIRNKNQEIVHTIDLKEIFDSKEILNLKPVNNLIIKYNIATAGTDNSDNADDIFLIASQKGLILHILNGENILIESNLEKLRSLGSLLELKISIEEK
ncbi:MAG: hypothetical protein KBA66_20195 [Leptospiraceae bacterium]|nr:hypothetical protein [Leptospiraceae bacterium]